MAIVIFLAQRPHFGMVQPFEIVDVFSATNVMRLLKNFTPRAAPYLIIEHSKLHHRLVTITHCNTLCMSRIRLHASTSMIKINLKNMNKILDKH